MPCSHGYKSPQEYYNIATSCGSIDKVFTVFGRTASEVLKALQYWDEHSIYGCDSGKKIHWLNTEEIERERLRLLNESNSFIASIKKEQSKMTREEAVKRIADKIGNHFRSDTMVNCLEALGLLKFDEVLKKTNKVFQVTKEALQAIKDLIGVSNENNFVCTRIGDFVYQSLKEEVVKFDHVLFPDGHVLKFETVVRALNAKGCVVYKNGMEL